MLVNPFEIKQKQQHGKKPEKVWTIESSQSDIETHIR